MGNIGFIYKITNNINSMVYIGQTKKTIEERFRIHINDLGKVNDYSYLHRAMKKYGVNNFKVELVEECLLEMLDERECYWISFYDSFYNGYNLTLGGSGNRSLVLNENEICSFYINGHSISSLALYYDVSNTSITQIIKKYSINIRSLKEQARLNSIAVVASGFNEELRFNSLIEAGEYVFDSGLSAAKDGKNASSCIRVAIISGKTLYGYKWSSPDLDESYIEQKREKMKRDNLNYSREYHKNSKIKCPFCSNLINNYSTMCTECYYSRQRSKSKCPTFDVLRDLRQSNVPKNGYSENV